MKIGHIELFVRDSVAARDWYVKVLGAKHIADQGELQWISFSDAELLLRPGFPEPSANYRLSQIALVFYLEDLSAFKANLELNDVMYGNGDEDECLTFQDHDGHWIQAVQHS